MCALHKSIPPPPLAILSPLACAMRSTSPQPSNSISSRCNASLPASPTSRRIFCRHVKTTFSVPKGLSSKENAFSSPIHPPLSAPGYRFRAAASKTQETRVHNHVTHHTSPVLLTPVWCCFAGQLAAKAASKAERKRQHQSTPEQPTLPAAFSKHPCPTPRARQQRA